MQPNYDAWDTSCWECGEVITNPLCPKCLAGEIEDWLAWRNPELIPSVRQLSETAEHKEHNTTNCILCGDDIDTCTFCFVQDIIELLKLTYPEMVDQFLMHFSYDAKYELLPVEVLAM